MAHRMIRKRRGDVDPCEHVTAGGDLFAPRGCGLSERFQMRGFGGDGMDARLRNPACRFVKVGRIEAHDARERLAMGKA